MIRRRKSRLRPARLFFALLTLAALAACWVKYHGVVLDAVEAWLCAKPPGIILHHSARLRRWRRIIDAAALDRMHARRGFMTWYRGKAYQ